MPGRRKIGGCSIASMLSAPCAPTRGRARSGRKAATVSPSHERDRMRPAVGEEKLRRRRAHAANRSPAPRTTRAPPRRRPPSRSTDAASATSHRKFRIARTAARQDAQRRRRAREPASRRGERRPRPPPCRASPAPSAHLVSSSSRSARFTDRKRFTNPAAIPSPEPEQQEPGRRSQAAIRAVAPDEPDHRCDHQREPDRGKLAERFPGPLIPGRRHVKMDTSTMLPDEQAIGSG